MRLHSLTEKLPSGVADIHEVKHCEFFFQVVLPPDIVVPQLSGPAVVSARRRGKSLQKYDRQRLEARALLESSYKKIYKRKA